MESLGRPSISLGDLFCSVPLVLKMDCFRIPLVDLFWHSIKRCDAFHEQGRDSSSEETDQNVVVSYASAGGVTLESGDVTFQ